jgi:hypothetical protein
MLIKKTFKNDLIKKNIKFFNLLHLKEENENSFTTSLFTTDDPKRYSYKKKKKNNNNNQFFLLRETKMAKKLYFHSRIPQLEVFLLKMWEVDKKRRNEEIP